MWALLIQVSVQPESRTWRRLPISQYSMTMRNCGQGPAGSHMVTRVAAPPGLVLLLLTVLVLDADAKDSLDVGRLEPPHGFHLPGEDLPHLSEKQGQRSKVGVLRLQRREEQLASCWVTRGWCAPAERIS